MTTRITGARALALTLLLGGFSSAQAQVTPTPPNGAVPPGAGIGNTAPVAPGTTPATPAASPNLFSFICPTAEQKAACQAKFCASGIGQLINNGLKPASTLTGGVIPTCCPLIPPADLAKSAESAEGAAARIKADEAAAKARRAAVRYLGSVDCTYWPEAVEALRNSLRADRNECVRLEAALALGRGCCCNKATIKALTISVSGSREDDNPAENSPRVRAAAAHALKHCLACYLSVDAVPSEPCPLPPIPKAPIRKEPIPKKKGPLPEEKTPLPQEVEDELPAPRKSKTPPPAKNGPAEKSDDLPPPRRMNGMTASVAKQAPTSTFSVEDILAEARRALQQRSNTEEGIIDEARRTLQRLQTMPSANTKSQTSSPVAESSQPGLLKIFTNPGPSRQNLPEAPTQTAPPPTKSQPTNSGLFRLFPEEKTLARAPMVESPLRRDRRVEEEEPVVVRPPAPVKPVVPQRPVAPQRPIVEEKPAPRLLPPAPEIKPVPPPAAPSGGKSLFRLFAGEKAPAPTVVRNPEPRRLPPVQDEATARLVRQFRKATDPFEREQIVNLLASQQGQPGPDVVGMLLLAARQDSSPLVRVACVRALMTLKVEHAEIPELAAALQSDGELDVTFMPDVDDGSYDQRPAPGVAPQHPAVERWIRQGGSDYNVTIPPSQKPLFTSSEVESWNRRGRTNPEAPVAPPAVPFTTMEAAGKPTVPVQPKPAGGHIPPTGSDYNATPLQRSVVPFTANEQPRPTGVVPFTTIDAAGAGSYGGPAGYAPQVEDVQPQGRSDYNVTVPQSTGVPLPAIQTPTPPASRVVPFTTIDAAGGQLPYQQ